MIEHDEIQRYYRLRRLGLNKELLYDRFGLHPAINMYYLGSEIIHALLGHVGEITIVHTREYQGMVISTFVFHCAELAVGTCQEDGANESLGTPFKRLYRN